MKYLGGFNFIELIVGLLVSSVVVAILMHGVLLIQRQTEAIAQQMHRVEEEAWIVSFLQTRFHQAGFTPCRRLDELKPVDTREERESLHSVELISPNQLTLRHMSGEFETVRLTVDAETLFVSNMTLNKAYPVLVSDCRHAEIHSIEDIRVTNEGVRIILKRPLLYQYDVPFYVGEWISESFFIKHHRLFYQHHHVDELTPMIHNMFGVIRQENGHVILTLQLNDDHQTIEMHGRNV